MTQEAHTSHALAGAYALDALSEHERRQFEAHLAECEICAQEVRGLQETAARLAVAAAHMPPPGLRDRVLAEASQVRQLPPRLGRVRPGGARWMPRLLAVAAAACLVVAAVLGFSLVQARSDLDRANELNAVLTAPDAQQVTQPVANGGSADVVASPALGKAVVMMNGLRAVSGKDYEMWLMGDNSVRSAGLVAAPASGPRLLNIGGAKALGLTIEDKGGSKSGQPTTQPILNLPFPV